jgi:azurin
LAIALASTLWVIGCMNLRPFIATALIAVISAGCGKKDATASSTATPASTPAAEANATTASAAAPAKSGVRTIEITAGDTMKFNITSIEAKPGEELKVVLTNIGTQPKEVMGHNWVLLKAGTDVAAFDAAAVTAKASDYIPDSLKDQIIAHTVLLGPRKSDEITFKVPTTPGDYPFLCTFPAHYQVGMKGVLTVK